MSTRAKLVGAVSLGLLLHGMPAHVLAQGKQQPKQFKPQAANVSAEVSGIKGGVLLVSEGEGKNYLVRFAPDATVDVTGEGDVSLLGPGMDVDFEVKLDKKDNATEEIQKINIFILDPKTGGRQDIEAKGEDKYQVVGRVASIARNGKMSVSVGKRTVKGTVARDATVTVGLRGARWARLARPGDSASLFGDLLQPPTPNSPGLLLAKEVKLELKKASGEAEKSRPGKKKPEKEKAKEKSKEKEKS